MRKIIASKHVTSAGILTISLLVANFASFVFNAYLGRMLSFSDFGVITLLNSFWYLLSIPINALGTTLTHRVAYLMGKEGESEAGGFFVYFAKVIFLPVIITSAVWLLFSPFIANFFKVDSLLPVFLFSPAIYLGTYSLVDRSYLQGQLLFSKVSVTILIENISRLLLAVLFVSFGVEKYTYLSIPLSILLAFLSASLYVRRQKPVPNNNLNHRFPSKFYIASFLSNLSTTAFITIDVVLVKHFFDQNIAGQYALLSLIGKMIYFFGTLLNSVLFTHVSNAEGKSVNSKSLFNKVLLLSSLFTFGMFFVLGPMGETFTPILFGDKIKAIAPYLTLYAFGISLFTISNIIAVYYLAKQKFIFSAVGIFSTLLLTLTIAVFHADLLQITYSILSVSLITLTLTLLLHILKTHPNE